MPVSPAARPRLKASAAQRPPLLGAPQPPHGLTVFSLRSWHGAGQAAGPRAFQEEVWLPTAPRRGAPPPSTPTSVPGRSTRDSFWVVISRSPGWHRKTTLGLSRSKSGKRISNPVCKNCVPLVSGPAPQSCLWEKHQLSRH